MAVAAAPSGLGDGDGDGEGRATSCGSAGVSGKSRELSEINMYTRKVASSSIYPIRTPRWPMGIEAPSSASALARIHTTKKTTTRTAMGKSKNGIDSVI